MNKYFKLVLFVLISAYGGYEIYLGHIANGVSLIFLGSIVLFFFYRNESIFRVFLKLKKQDFEGAKKILLKIKNPSRILSKGQIGYYYYLQGIITSQTNMSASEKFFKKSIILGLRMSHDLAIAKLNLAGISISKRNKREATKLINEAKKLDKRGMLDSQIKMIKQQLKRI